MKTLENIVIAPTPIPNSETLVRTLRNAIGAFGIAFAKARQRSAERALADAVIEQHFRDAKQKAFELTMGIRSDYWKGH